NRNVGGLTEANVLFLIQSSRPVGSRGAHSRLACLSTPAPSVPIHAHLGDFLALGFAEKRPSGFHPFAGAPAPERALELGGKPGPNAKDLTGTKPDFRLMVRDVIPV